MERNTLGIILSFVFIGVIIATSSFLQKRRLLDEEGSRKFIHIGVSNWWFILILFFDNVWLACIPPIVFILLNYASYKLNLIKAMERDKQTSLGTVYYPISLLILVIASFYLKMPYLGALGILIMGYGDGLAGYIGKKYGKRKLLHNKTVAGTTTMFLVSLFISYIVFANFASDFAIIGSVLVAVGAAFIELITPKGLDNITVPLGTSLIFYIITSIGGQPIFISFIIGFAISELVAIAAYFRKSLSGSGVIAATIIGTAIYVFAGLVTWTSLILFFISSSVITQFKKANKAKLSTEYHKTSRNYKQVLASGLIPAILSLAYFITKSESILITTIASIAVSCADTWASEIGVLNKGATVSILTFKPIRKGESGGVSALGTIASIMGALMIAVVFVASFYPGTDKSWLFVIQTLFMITAIGALGSVIDSVLGASLQVKYIDNSTKAITEAKYSHDKQNHQKSGLSFMNNDMVNFVSSILSVIVALAIFVR
ncbi:DUF92 domain-containing protein [Candidatus Saccharibacteria bacterium]|nr:DUF92 domain-containing protein [Candidatus Saccharibacteria bacterium]